MGGGGFLVVPAGARLTPGTILPGQNHYRDQWSGAGRVGRLTAEGHLALSEKAYSRTAEYRAGIYARRGRPQGGKLRLSNGSSRRPDSRLSTGRLHPGGSPE